MVPKTTAALIFLCSFANMVAMNNDGQEQQRKMLEDQLRQNQEMINQQLQRQEQARKQMSQCHYCGASVGHLCKCVGKIK